MRSHLLKLMFLLFSLGLGSSLLLADNSYKIGVVDLNRALNESESGIRSRNSLETKGRQREKEVQQGEEELRSGSEELSNNVLLSPEAKAKKATALREKEQKLRERVQQIQQELQNEERKLTEDIFKELKGSIRAISIKEKFDIVLEKTASEVILYMNMDTTDLTQKVIDHYNSLKNTKK